MLNVVVALKVWSLSGRIKSVVEVLTPGKTKDSFLATCTRNIWLICAIFNIHIRVWHLPGKLNHTVDILYRWAITNDPVHKLYNLLSLFIWIPANVDLTKLNYDI